LRSPFLVTAASRSRRRSFAANRRNQRRIAGDTRWSSNIIMNFLSAKGISPKINGSTEELRGPEVVADLAKKFTVQIFCQSGATKVGSAEERSPSSGMIADLQK
jgi:hypothetical protein